MGWLWVENGYFAVRQGVVCGRYLAVYAISQDDIYVNSYIVDAIVKSEYTPLIYSLLLYTNELNMVRSYVVIQSCWEKLRLTIYCRCI